MGENGKVTGNFYENPMLNRLIYECEFPDGTIKEYAANIIAENIFNEPNPNGHQDMNMIMPVNHERSGDALKKGEWIHNPKSGQKHTRQTTMGWKLLVK